MKNDLFILSQLLFKGTQEREFFGSDFEFCTISLLVKLLAQLLRSGHY